MNRVTFLCPVAEDVPVLTFQTALSAVGYASANGVKIEYIGVTERTLVDAARNVLTREFLKTPSDWSFWLDSDMVIPKETITRLLSVAEAESAKMVTGIYYQRGRKHWPVCWLREPILENGQSIKHINQNEYDANEHLGSYVMPGPEANAPFQVSTAGMGCCLIHRSVFETLDDPWFLFINGKCSEDFYFFVSARKKGFTLWADPSLRIGHIGGPKVVYREDCYEKMNDNKTALVPMRSGSAEVVQV